MFTYLETWWELLFGLDKEQNSMNEESGVHGSENELYRRGRRRSRPFCMLP